MSNFAISDWIAFYGAALSTLIAVVAVYRYAMDGPRLAVEVFNPSDYNIGDRYFGFVISNIGNIPTVVSNIEIAFLEKRARKATAFKTVNWNQKSSWNPAIELIPKLDRPNSFTRSPKVLHKGDELHGTQKPVAEYDATTHWIRLRAFPRNSERYFEGWAGPVPKQESETA